MEKSIKDLLISELRDILRAEEQIVQVLPKIAAAADSLELKTVFTSHLKETKGQIQRLKKVFKILKIDQKSKFCHAAKGLIQECHEVLEDFKTKSPIRDAALISKVQRIEHYEISAYGTVRAFAQEISLREVVKLLQSTLDEEGAANKKLTKIAEGGFLKSGINHLANVKNEPVKKINKKTATSQKKSGSSSPRKASSPRTKSAPKKSSAVVKKSSTAQKKPSALKKKNTVKKPKKTHSK